MPVKGKVFRLHKPQFKVNMDNSTAELDWELHFEFASLLQTP